MTSESTFISLMRAMASDPAARRDRMTAHQFDIDTHVHWTWGRGEAHGRIAERFETRVERIIKLGVFVNSAPSFTDQAKVANGASDLFETLFGDAGRHARAAVGVAVLPLGAAVEADAIVAVRPA